jgi:hypothetical protein
MPYSVGEKGSYGCSGYPVIKDDDKQVMGCHDTQDQAAAQIYAIEQSEEKANEINNSGIGIKNPEKWPVKKNSITEGDFVMGTTSEGVVHGRVEHIMWEGGTLGTPGEEYSLESMPPENPAMSVRIFEEEDGRWEATAYSIGMMYQDAQVIDINNHSMEDMDKGLTDSNGMPSATGQPYPASSKEFASPVPKKKTGDTSMSDEVEKACWEGYVQRGMKEKDGRMVPNCVPAAKKFDLWEDGDDVVYDGDLEKAEGYSPPAGARSAARRAIKFKEDGKATGAGTAVGWTRARQLVNGETLSLSTVKRMYSYFSRHEVDKKGKDWGNQANPSKGYVMWLAWGGDAGYSWSRKIVEREKDKALFADLFKAPDNMPNRSYVSWFRVGE